MMWRRTPILALAVTISVVALTLPGAGASTTAQDTITTHAGTTIAGFSGDGGPATAARLDKPRDTDIGPDGSLYIADTFNHRIRRVGPNGTITTIAGTGVAGYSGDGGPATQAMIQWPHDVLVADDGAIFIADSANHRIRRIAPNGTITTIAGTGRSGFAGDGGPAVAARLKNPKGLARHGHHLYIADGMNHRIRRVNLSNGVITTVAGTGDRGFGGDGGPAIDAALNIPQRIDVDGSGAVYIADSNNHRIRRFRAGGTMTTVVGSGALGGGGDGGQARAAQLRYPRGVAVADGVLYVADSGNQRVRRVELASGIITALAGTGTPDHGGDGGPAVDATLQGPRGVTIDPAGRLFVADTDNSAVRVLVSDAYRPPPAPLRCQGRRVTLAGTEADDVLVGTPGVDVIAGLAGDDVIEGRGGDDIVCGGAGNDIINGGKGSDDLFGGAGADNIKGFRGKDFIYGGPGDDRLNGGSGRDQVWGAGQLDECWGEQLRCEVPHRTRHNG
ncbi:MAG: hypothetical protein ACR2QE_03910 [Acidimicrobiales bacterium]